MNQKKKTIRGGSRKGAGRKTGPPTELLVFRAPVTVINDAKKLFGKTLHKRFNIWLASIVKKAEKISS